MKESAIYKRLIEIPRKTGNDLLIQKIESGGTGLGIPDIFIRTMNKDIWMECKQITWPKRSNEIKIPFQPGQLKWISNYIRLGGTAFLAVLVGYTSPRTSQVYFFKNYSISGEYTKDMFENACSCFDTPYRPFRHTEVYNMLTIF
jgi:hypothetical protein